VVRGARESRNAYCGFALNCSRAASLIAVSCRKPVFAASIMC
jgi:hypothetical protein